MTAAVPTPRKTRSLAHVLVDAVGDRIRDGRLQPGDKLRPEATIMAEFGVSRTVVREAISRLQTSGLVSTRHGVGTFVVGLGEATPFRIAPEPLATLQDVIAVLEFRIGIETEACALAALRRTDANLVQLRTALAAVTAAIEIGHNSVGADFQFHLEIARATHNPHFVELMTSLGASIIPRARLVANDASPSAPHSDYLRRVNSEHESIFDAIDNQDPEAARAAMRTHLSHSRERRRRAMLTAAKSTAT